MRKAAGGATHALAETCGTATLFLNREKECIGIQIIAVVSVIGDRIRKIRLSDPPLRLPFDYCPGLFLGHWSDCGRRPYMQAVDTFLTYLSVFNPKFVAHTTLQHPLFISRLT